MAVMVIGGMGCLWSVHLQAQCCPMNFSFERPSGSCFGQTVGVTCVPGQASTEVWQSCPAWGCGSVDLGPNPGGSLNMGQVQPTDGNNYISMECRGSADGANLGEGFSLSFCTDVVLTAGTEFCISLDLVTWTNNGFVCPPFSFNGCPGNSRLVVYGSSSPCSTTQVLWTSPTLSGTWTNYSFCFVPTASWSVISFRVLNTTSGLSAVGLDNMMLTQPGDYFTTDCNTLSGLQDDLEVVCRNGERVLRWIVDGSLDIARFSVLKSVDLEQWSVLGELEADAWTSAPSHYEFLDGSSGGDDGSTVYYQVVHHRDNGTDRSSRVAIAHCEFLLYPNPADEVLHVRTPLPGSTVELVDALGRVVRVVHVSSTRAEVQVGDLAAGHYAARLVLNGALLARGTFIKS